MLDADMRYSAVIQVRSGKCVPTNGVAVGHFEFVPTGVAVVVMPLPDMICVADRTAARADRAIRPADSIKMRPAGFLIGKLLQKVEQRYAPDMGRRP